MGVASHDSLFFSERSNGEVQRAKRICNGDPLTGIKPCPVRTACLDYALTQGERFGVWGGCSERERRRLQKARRQAEDQEQRSA